MVRNLPAVSILVHLSGSAKEKIGTAGYLSAPLPYSSLRLPPANNASATISTSQKSGDRIQISTFRSGISVGRSSEYL